MEKIKFGGTLDEGQMEAMSEEATELLSKEILTEEEKRRLTYIQLLVLLNMKQLPLLKKLPLGFGKERLISREDIAMKLGHAARARARKTVKDRKFLNELLVARGSTALDINRDSDPTRIRYDRSDDVMGRIGDSSDYEER